MLFLTVKTTDETPVSQLCPVPQLLVSQFCHGFIGVNNAGWVVFIIATTVRVSDGMPPALVMLIVVI